MTQMQQFDGTEHITMYHEPERTSIAAILGLVLGCIGCCGGITAIPGIFLSIFGIVGISRSKGRIGGMGFAIAGLLISLFTLALWGAALGGAVFAGKQMDSAIVQPMFGVLGDLESGDFDAARAVLGKPAADASDEELIAFRDAYLAMLGPVVSTPDGLLDYVKEFIELAEVMSDFSGRSNLIPIPMEFDQGSGLVLIFFDQNQANGQAPITTEFVILDGKGNAVSLPADLYTIEAAPEAEIEDFSNDSSEVEDQADEEASEGP